MKRIRRACKKYQHSPLFEVERSIKGFNTVTEFPATRKEGEEHVDKPNPPIITFKWLHKEKKPFGVGVIDVDTRISLKEKEVVEETKEVQETMLTAMDIHNIV